MGRQRLFIGRDSGLLAVPWIALMATVRCSPETCRWAGLRLGTRMTAMAAVTERSRGGCGGSKRCKTDSQAKVVC